MSDEDRVVITIKDIYAEMQKLVIEVRRLAQHYDNGKAIDDDHERRIRNLEAWKYGLPVALLTAVGSVIVAFMKG